MFRESYKSAMNEIETNKELLNSLLEKADIPQKGKFTVIKRAKIYTMSTLATAAAVMIVAFGIKGYDEPVKEKGEEMATPRIVSEEAMDKRATKMATYDGFAINESWANSELREKELTEKEYFNYIGLNIEKLKIPADLKRDSENKISILKDDAKDEIINDYHTFSFKGDSERYVSISTAKTKEEDIDWIKTVEDKNYMSAYSVKNGTMITVECYMLKDSEKKSLLDSFKN